MATTLEIASICRICSESMDKKSLSCGHSFHERCIDNWLRDNGTCPNCRKFITSSTTEFTDATIECSVCLENILAYMPLPCGHIFHEMCVLEETAESKICPTCFEPMFNKEEDDMCVCPICRKAIVYNERILPCGHIFHENCVLKETADSKICPTCSEPILNEEEDDKCLCPICREAIVYNERILPCGHIFHEDCVIKETADSKICPTCSEPILNKEDDDRQLCLFCQGAVVNNQETRPCGHYLHEFCVLPWIRQKNYCPECLIPIDYESPLKKEPNANEATCLLCYKVINSNQESFPCGHRYHINCANLDNFEECLVCQYESGVPLQHVKDKESCIFCCLWIIPDVVNLPCYHRFHQECASFWFHTHKKCPECQIPVDYQTLGRNGEECIFCSTCTTDDLTTAPCGHIFHNKCIYPFHQERKVCPECNLPIRSEPELLNTPIPQHDVFSNTASNIQSVVLDP